MKKEIAETLEHLDVIQKQSLNLFNKPEVQHRVLQLLAVMDDQVHAFNKSFAEPSSEQNHSLQNLFFNVKKMQETTQQLKIDPQKLELHQAFAAAIDAIKEDLNQL